MRYIGLLYLNGPLRGRFAKLRLQDNHDPLETVASAIDTLLELPELAAFSRATIFSAGREVPVDALVTSLAGYAPHDIVLLQESDHQLFGAADSGDPALEQIVVESVEQLGIADSLARELGDVDVDVLLDAGAGAGVSPFDLYSVGVGMAYQLSVGLDGRSLTGAEWSAVLRQYHDLSKAYGSLLPSTVRLDGDLKPDRIATLLGSVRDLGSPGTDLSLISTLEDEDAQQSVAHDVNVKPAAVAIEPAQDHRESASEAKAGPSEVAAVSLLAKDQAATQDTDAIKVVQTALAAFKLVTRVTPVAPTFRTTPTTPSDFLCIIPTAGFVAPPRLVRRKAQASAVETKAVVASCCVCHKKSGANGYSKRVDDKPACVSCYDRVCCVCNAKDGADAMALKPKALTKTAVNAEHGHESRRCDPCYRKENLAASRLETAALGLECDCAHGNCVPPDPEKPRPKDLVKTRNRPNFPSINSWKRMREYLTNAAKHPFIVGLGGKPPQPDQLACWPEAITWTDWQLDPPAREPPKAKGKSRKSNSKPAEPVDPSGSE